MSNMKCAFSIPYTKRHIRFTEETEALLNKMNIKYNCKVRIEDEAQESFLDFFVSTKDLDKANVCVQMTSKKLISRKDLGLRD